MKSTRLWVFLLFILVAIMPACGGQQGSSTGPLIIKNGTVIDGTGTDPIEDGIVVIEGDRITLVGSGVGFSIPPNAQVIDAHGGTILPGFVDAHVHSTSDPGLRREFLLGGVTAVCDLGTPLDEIDQFDKEYLGDEPAARGYKAGTIITALGGMPDAVLHANLNYEVGTPEEARAAVVDLHDRSADMIKVYLHGESGGTQYPMLDEELLAAIVEEAHAQGLYVRAHVTYIDLFDMALKADVDTIEHMPINSAQPYFQNDSEAKLQLFNDADQPLQVFFDEIDPEYEGQLEMMAASGIIMVPTLDRPYGELFRLSDPTREYSIIMEIILGIVRAFHELGGIVALGTDFNIGVGVQAGIPLGEIEMLLATGLTPMEVIIAGTRNAAAACGQANDLGTLESGMLADVIVVDGNPMEDYRVLANVVVVIKNGEIAFRK
ncbi:MAG: amidohydrolase family protein [Candidatus Promineifilaceae bacterium]